MLNVINAGWILLPAILVFTGILLFNRWRINQETHLIKRAFRLLRLYFVLFAAFIGITWLLVSVMTVPLSTFGYPDGIENIQSPEQLLSYLQGYNRALVLNIQAFSWFIFVFAVWFLFAMYEFSRTVANALLENQYRR
ncbi:hypothetical protein [Vacuolonema iberomarrocanum]|uniref:hypothetical protein n=1 Tax=Vacuolonema iberomarrocanum TaxID=3454632 RepID=UPI001A0E8579|nr:hypothetical protein [filamentous cyanobacterium LEGE 07170]